MPSTDNHIATAQREQREAAARYIADGHPMAELGMGDWFAEEFLMEEEKMIMLTNHSTRGTAEDVRVMEISASLAGRTVLCNHYLHRKPPISKAFGLLRNSILVGVCTFGTPASRHLQTSVCPSNPGAVIELNRLWVSDDMPRNTESWFVSRCLALLPPRIVVSYADSAVGHSGYIYRALNFKFAGMTDEDRKTPRFDYVMNDGHSRSAFRDFDSATVKEQASKVRRLPKWRYWTVTGNRRQSRALLKITAWPSKKWTTEAVGL